jgi:hypothetical protein
VTGWGRITGKKQDTNRCAHSKRVLHRQETEKRLLRLQQETVFHRQETGNQSLRAHSKGQSSTAKKQEIDCLPTP